MNNDSLYNPDSMSKEDIKALFVARQPLLNELVSTIKSQSQGAGVQHLIIIAPRGMGKTTMLLMVQFAVEDNDDLAKDWQAVRFPEENYDITELADFWLKVLRYLDDEKLDRKIEEIEARFTKSEELREAAWALVKDWSKENKKRILLLIDNFDMILDQIGSETEQARLRDILMNDGTAMLIGCAPSYFHQIQDYEQPLYNFFKIYNLNDLKFPDIEELLRKRAELDEIPNIEELLRKNKTRIKALETFTGGNPRLVLMLYRIITSSDMTEVRIGLEKLLDAVTPYYKDKTERLPPQQRKIINEIAQYGLEKNEGISPTEIAKRIRMTPNQVSMQLKRLSDNGYVRSLNIRGRSSFYVISEPLYAIWAQMRFGRNAREKRKWLVQILKAIYDLQEIQKEIEKLDERVKKFRIDGRNTKVLGTLEYILCLMETNSNLMDKYFPLAIEGYLELDEISSLKTEVNIERLSEVPKETLKKLNSHGVINETQYLEVATRRLDKSLNILQNTFKGKDPLELLKAIDKIKQPILDELNKTEDKFTYTIIFTIICVFKINWLLETEKKDLAIDELNTSINVLINAKSSINFTDLLFNLYLIKIDILLSQSILDEAKIVFKESLNYLKNEENWIEIALKTMSQFLATATPTNLNNEVLVNMIKIEGYEKEFFPLIRAIDYIETGDKELIEKLSPEVRVVVDETIKTL
ncbi:MAG TPA: winged helix-turn-helix transcriptional regulator, partial [Pyrinomonadaceae bacterium]|nr:winged helix-turn-helix transcriptional regulator [Pyrinomonadaceae bacterium]